MNKVSSVLSVSVVAILTAAFLLSACNKDKEIAQAIKISLEPDSLRKELDLYIIPADTQSVVYLNVIIGALPKSTDQIIDINTTAGWLLDEGAPKRNMQKHIKKENENTTITILIRAPATAEQGNVTIKTVGIDKHFSLKYTPLKADTPVTRSLHPYGLTLTPNHTSVPLDSSIKMHIRLFRDTALALTSPGQLVVYSMEPYTGPGNNTDTAALYTFSPSSFVYFQGDGNDSGHDSTYLETTVRITNQNGKSGRVIFRASAQSPYVFYREVLLEWF
jgi:hypothetical protein